MLLDNPAITDFSPQHTIDMDDAPDLLTVAEYRKDVQHHLLLDYDGFGHPVALMGERFCEDQRHTIKPSMKGADIPEGATHINWFNK